ncbi:MAG: CHAT domain-containing protein, partial [Kamptonema sp. SIO4C4]|nr:CHAT domain-containing protein [Kamptonema sp. SIO4C4]
VTVSNSSIIANSANQHGGGIYSEGNLTTTNSTISSNWANGNGGGILDKNGGTITNSTIAFNTTNAGDGGGINRFGTTGTLNIQNSIIAQNTDIGGQAHNLSGTFDSIINSLLGDTNGATLTTNNNNIIGQNPQLSALGNYGGTTQTHALLPGSPAINTGTSANAPTTDQRGFPRGISTNTVDIGAFEVNANIQASQSLSNPNPQPGETVTITLNLTNTGDAVGGVSLTSLLPSGFTLQDVTPSQGTYNPTTGLWTIGTLDGAFDLLSVGNSATLTFTAQVPEDDNINTANPIATSDLDLIGENLTPLPEWRLLSSQNTATTSSIDVLTSIPAFNNSTETGIEETEQEATDTYAEYFGIKKPRYLRFADIQQMLREIEARYGIKPAFLYARFQPSSNVSDEPGQLLWEYRHNQGEKPTLPSDELELSLLTSTGEVITRRIPGATRAKIRQVARRFRSNVTNRSRLSNYQSPANNYLSPAQKLYQWLIKPMEAELEAQEIENLSLILDRGLLSLPFAAFHDGEQYLIEHYSLGLIPSASFIDPHPWEREQTTVLAMGSDTFTDHQSLPGASLEVQTIPR